MAAHTRQVCFVGIGSNIDAELHVREALARMSQWCRLKALSTVYENDAVGPDGRIMPGSPPFLNLVAAVETAADMVTFYILLRGIEEDMGRQRDEDRYAPRTIDLDILVFGDAVISLEIGARAFVCVPLSEVAPGLVLSHTCERVSDLARAVDSSGLRPVVPFSSALRKEFLD